ncbi:MAG: purine-nucleoside phosphorylase [Bacteroidetes bacterium]|nr:purine-nucleoside phosphorylase [Bacteroidota bacterium]
MSIHISAPEGQIAEVVLMPGDPLRARFMVKKFLTGAELVSQTRNIYFYTGNYMGKRITIGASGMGCPSIGIYSYELFSFYGVQTIIRIGTCGAYQTNLSLYDLLLTDLACSESSYALHAWGLPTESIQAPGIATNKIELTALNQSKSVKKVNIHSSDVFYRKESGIPAIATKYRCQAVEMEAFALFANAQELGRSAATLLTVSDIIPTHEKISADQRETALLPMMEIALESARAL